MSIKRERGGWVQGLAVRWETAVESVLGVVSDKQSVQCEGLPFLPFLPFLPSHTISAISAISAIFIPLAHPRRGPQCRG